MPLMQFSIACDIGQLPLTYKMTVPVNFLFELVGEFLSEDG